MADINIQCTGPDAVRIDRQRSGSSDIVYLTQGQSAPLDGAFLAEASVAEGGKPQFRLSNTTDDERVEVFSVHDGGAVRGRPLAPHRSRLITLDEGERQIFIPVSASASASTRSKAS